MGGLQHLPGRVQAQQQWQAPGDERAQAGLHAGLRGRARRRRGGRLYPLREEHAGAQAARGPLDLVPGRISALAPRCIQAEKRRAAGGFHPHQRGRDGLAPQARVRRDLQAGEHSGILPDIFTYAYDFFLYNMRRRITYARAAHTPGKKGGERNGLQQFT